MNDEPGRVLYAALHLLDHQMIDRDEYRCGNVDDLELDERDDGTIVATHLLAGPGVLAERLGHHRLGKWWRHTNNATDEDVRIPMSAVTEIGSRIRLAADAADLGTARTERWARERVIDHIPGHTYREPDPS
jgi:hypothetical protein